MTQGAPRWIRHVVGSGKLADLQAWWAALAGRTGRMKRRRRPARRRRTRTTTTNDERDDENDDELERPTAARRRADRRCWSITNLAVAGAQPREGDRRRGDGSDGGDPGDLPPPRALTRGQGAGRDRAPAVPGAAAARAGKGKDRQRGGIGGKGAGEASLELDRRKIRDRIAELKRELAAMPRSSGRSAPAAAT